ncbi:hypothetical protein ACWCP6_33290 [Streptomyces sp. NPDC002004]
MTVRDGAPGDGTHEVRVLINEIEGHLLLEATRAEGRAAAVRFVDRLGWPTDSQREDIERLYAEEFMETSRRAWQHTARRAAQLAADYRRRYVLARRRLTAGLLCGAAALVTLMALAVWTG